MCVLVRVPKPIFQPNPAWIDKVFFMVDFISLGPLYYISGGYQACILELTEKSKMAAKMAAAA